MSKVATLTTISPSGPGSADNVTLKEFIVNGNYSTTTGMPHWCYVIIVFSSFSHLSLHFPRIHTQPRTGYIGISRRAGRNCSIVLDGEWSRSFSMLDMAGLPFDTPVLHLKFSRPASCIVIQAGISRHC